MDREPRFDFRPHRPMPGRFPQLHQGQSKGDLRAPHQAQWPSSGDKESALTLSRQLGWAPVGFELQLEKHLQFAEDFLFGAVPMGR